MIDGGRLAVRRDLDLPLASARSVGIAAAQRDDDGLQLDLHIEQQRPVAQVGEVAPNARLHLHEGLRLAALDELRLESLLLNLDAALRVHARPHFFLWTQGLLQSLIRHEVLVCALGNGEAQNLRAESFGTLATDAAVFGELFERDAGAAPGLIKAWKGRRFHPVICDARDGATLGAGAFARELQRVGATQVLAHGVCDAAGQVGGFYAFGCRACALGQDEAYLVQLALPSLHAAWLRAQASATGAPLRAAPSGSALSPREREVLHWIYVGKSNYEIGTILRISPLTVKNHVQKILRKLNVVNRAQAVGKALETRVLVP